MLKKTLILLAFILSGCNHESITEQYAVNENKVVSVNYPSGWYKNKKQNPYDFQYFSQNKQMTTGISTFNRKDIPKSFTPELIFELQIADLKSKRDNFKIEEAEQTIQKAGKTITSVVYAGERDSYKYYYRFTLIKFETEPDVIVSCLQVGIPSLWFNHKPIFEEITQSIEVQFVETK